MFLTALLFALVQGITEFLPVSSSGHFFLLALVLEEESQPLRMISSLHAVISSLHVVTAAAAIAYYRREYAQAVSGIWRGGEGRRFAWRYAGAQVITVLAAAPLGALLWALSQAAVDHLHYGWVLGGMMLLNALILLAAPRRDDDPHDGTLPALTWRAAVWVGLAQGIAPLPGLSRSGLTVAAGLRAGLSPGHASSFCFLLAPPVMLLPTLYFLAGSWPEVSAWFSSCQSVSAMLVTILATFLVALGSLHWTVSWVRAGRLWWFAPWSGLVGLVTLAMAIR